MIRFSSSKTRQLPLNLLAQKHQASLFFPMARWWSFITVIYIIWPLSRRYSQCHTRYRSQQIFTSLSREYCVCGFVVCSWWSKWKQQFWLKAGCRVESRSSFNGRQKDQARGGCGLFSVSGGPFTSQPCRGRRWCHLLLTGSHFWNHRRWKIQLQIFSLSPFIWRHLYRTFGKKEGGGGCCWSNCPKSFGSRRSGGVFLSPDCLGFPFLPPRDILLSELWLSGKTCFQWLDHFLLHP